MCDGMCPCVCVWKRPGCQLQVVQLYAFCPDMEAIPSIHPSIHPFWSRSR